MMKKQAAFVLRARDRTGLEGILRDGNVPQKIVKRARGTVKSHAAKSKDLQDRLAAATGNCSSRKLTRHQTFHRFFPNRGRDQRSPDRSRRVRVGANPILGEKLG